MVRAAYANVYVSDLARAVDFFQGALGLPLLFRDDAFHYARFDAGPIYLGIAAVERSADNFRALVGRQTGIGLFVPDLDAAYEKLHGLGVRFSMAPETQPWGGRMAMLDDPDGNAFYLEQAHAREGA